MPNKLVMYHKPKFIWFISPFLPPFLQKFIFIKNQIMATHNTQRLLNRFISYPIN